MPPIDEVDRSIGERLKAARLRRQKTLSALADELGLTYQQVHKYESGRNRISASTLFKAAETLGIELSFFFSGCPQMRVGANPSYAADPSSDAELQAALMRIEDPEVRARLMQLLEAITDSDHWQTPK